ncbi:ribonuclease G [Dysgonomonas sp. PFB1-18]|uniref:Rne/Rng family ribonuclease n=1 Tax=unclassified Dysgonomonas TaxID=2630389 RepID=UPI00247722E7|nr:MULTISPECIES: Rne/Rng family ribonuclease [unclassified Dysgonomonas]MDH6310858.1 ribonuclease G [Dysgonomonas sp. PF1-14]MDH6340704.1 ribonuclease G [Dysgonomonas sp. PF1-16]MDH6382328.1 ribonuclease G [Dysgonomonas sp. PFB1-18]MDH6399678.1 ribonuclease G [Dysgonomonas sp. PF1-23]
MNSELVVDVQPNEVSIAVLEDKKLVELQKEGRDASYAVGNIYAGKVKKLMPGLNAAFVDIGYKKDAFLHYLDLGAQFKSVDKFYKQALNDKKKFPNISKMKLEPDINKDGSISDILKPGQEILVQIAKEPISTKGPRLTSELSLAGRFLVVIPFNDKVSVSQKIKSKEERARLRQLIQSIKPKNFGVIVRTVAEGKKVADLDTELKTLVKRWEDNLPKIQKDKLPTVVFEETGRIVALLRDVFNPSFQEIHVNDQDTGNQIKDYISFIAPEKKNIVKSYNGELPIFDNFNVTKQIKALFGKTVTFRNGAYLIIEHTEALHVVDVNSGNRSKNPEAGQENNAWEVNSAAAEEIARQLRLRDMGGIIVIDFIDMTEGEHRSQLISKMQELMANDRAKHNILPLSKFGLMQITRQRVRPEMEITTTETCPNCFGKGEIRPSILFTDTLRMKISYLVKDLNVKKFTLHVHPYVAAFINEGFVSLKWQWKWRYGMGVKIIPNQNLAFLEYHFYDVNGEEIDMKQEFEVK